MRRTVFTPALLALVLQAACGDLTLRDVAASYVLTEARRGPLPVLLSATINCDRNLVGGTLELTAQGGFTMSFDQAVDCSRAGGGTTPQEQVYTGVATLSDGRMRFFCDVASGSWQFEGRANSLSITLTVIDSGFEPSGALEVYFTR